MQHGWSRNVLVHQIESGRLHRQGKAVANFDCTLPAPQSDLARDIAKPIGISEYRLAESLPERLQGSLPTIEELEDELGARQE